MFAHIWHELVRFYTVILIIYTTLHTLLLCLEMNVFLCIYIYYCFELAIP